jgi:hypothetical protein
VPTWCYPAAVADENGKDLLLTSIRDEADDLAGFGWVQAPQYDPKLLGGEFRGNKVRGRVCGKGVLLW